MNWSLGLWISTIDKGEPLLEMDITNSYRLMLTTLRRRWKVECVGALQYAGIQSNLGTETVWCMKHGENRFESFIPNLGE